ncbi:MAG TPA: MAPEG family protein [Sphingobium sp.]|nr:MAPEG family protein [Sphingobium sp.]
MVAPMIAPALALVIWSLVMLVWMAAVRMPALAKLKLDPEQARGGRGQDLDRILPREANWPAHNYAHLMEQPTIFYATVLAIAILGAGTPLTVGLAWSYVGLRVIHSIWQATVNSIPVRSSLFFLSSVVLLVLAVNGLVIALTF